jgi:hypothetical protein
MPQLAWLPEPEFNEFVHDVWTEVDFMNTISEVQETPQNIPENVPEQFKESKLDLTEFKSKKGNEKLLTFDNVTYIFKTKREIGDKTQYHYGIIKYIDNSTWDPNCSFEPHYEAYVNFKMRNNPGYPMYYGRSLETLIERIESTKHRRDIEFQIIGLVKL